MIEWLCGLRFLMCCLTSINDFYLAEDPIDQVSGNHDRDGYLRLCTYDCEDYKYISPSGIISSVASIPPTLNGRWWMQTFQAKKTIILMNG